MFSHKELQILSLSEYHKVPTCALFLVVPRLPAVFREDILVSETKGACKLLRIDSTKREEGSKVLVDPVKNMLLSC